MIHPPFSILHHSDRAFGDRIQGFAFRVSCQPAGLVRSFRVQRSGVVADNDPTLEYQVPAKGSLTYVASFDEARGPVPLVLDAVHGTQVATISLDLSAWAKAGTVFEVTIDPKTATLSNQGGTTTGDAIGGKLRIQNTRFILGVPDCDPNGDGVEDPADIFYLVNYMFTNGPAPVGNGDANADGAVNPPDIFFMLTELFG